jgi:hypothetical protein
MNVAPKALPCGDRDRTMSPVIREMHATNKAKAIVLTRDRFILNPALHGRIAPQSAFWNATKFQQITVNRA